MLVLSTNFLQAQAQCTSVVSLENPAYYVSGGETIFEQTAVLTIMMSPGSTAPSGIPLQSLKISLFASYLQSFGGYQNSTSAIENLLTTGTVTSGSPNNYTYQGNPGAVALFDVQPTAGNNYFFVGQSSDNVFKIPLFKWKLRVTNPGGCNALTLIPSGSIDGSQVVSAGIVCQSAGVAIPLSAAFSNGGTFCSPQIDADIAGVVKKPAGSKAACQNNTSQNNPLGITGVTISLLKNNTTPSTDLPAGTGGEYLFLNQTTLDNYSLKASKKGDALCGVSTLDLVLMSKHILGTQPFTEWWQTVAADVNNSADPNDPNNQPVTTADMVELRKMILGINGGFSNNTSWRFFDEKTVPASLNETINITPLLKDELTNNFIGVKIGDVNGSCSDCGAQFAPETPVFLVRGETPLSLPNFSVAQGEETMIPVSIGEDNIGIAYSVGLRLDPEKFEILEVRPNDEFPDMGSDNFNVERTDEGIVKMLWNVNREYPLALRRGQILFSLRVRARQNIERISEVITLDNTLIENVNWTLEDENPKQVVLEFGANGRGLGKSKAVQTQTFANVSDVNSITFLQFSTPKKGKAALSVFNTQGKEVYHRNFEANAGNNTLEVDLSASTKSEMYYYLIQTSTEPITGRFVKISY
jgi:hypothetical protein